MKKYVLSILVAATSISATSRAQTGAKFEVETVYENCFMPFEDMAREVLLKLAADSEKSCQNKGYPQRVSNVVLSSDHNCWLFAKASYTCREF